MKIKNNLLPMLGWAKAKATASDFLKQVKKIAAKREYFDVFKSIIAATTPSVTDEDLFRFLKCYEVIYYDLDLDAASQTKASFLTMLSLAKDTEYSAISLWNEVFAFVADTNAKGGEFDLENRPPAIMKKLKRAYLSDMQKTLLRLSARSQDLLEVITDKIGSYHLDRSALGDEAAVKLSYSQVLMVTGEPGAGKSALSKALISTLGCDRHGYILAFKSDELLSGQLRDWFDNQHIHQDIKEIFSYFALLPNAVVYVDSMERLLESKAEPFRQLLASLQHIPNIKLVGSCRKSLLNLIYTKFFSTTPYAEQDIPYLSDPELDLVCEAVPSLKGAASNPELQELIRIPKYLDFAYKAIQTAGGDYSKISEVKFQQDLWSAIVENVCRCSANSENLEDAFRWSNIW